MRLLTMMMCLLLFGQPLPVEGGESLSAREIIANVQDLLRAETSTARYTMTIVTPEWRRTLRFDAWDDRKHRRFLIRILEPRKEKGVGWLKDGGNLWMYMPKLERDIRIPPSMMLSSWMGSDFTNDDLVKMESLVDDYDHQLIAEDDRGVTIVSLPKPDAPVVWGKIIHRVARDGLPVF
ncbi:MAG: outer membrane lipoprotein-sorting protein, partial [Zetaproteobacteria bacterium]